MPRKFCLVRSLVLVLVIEGDQIDREQEHEHEHEQKGRRIHRCFPLSDPQIE
ncbi:MAG TPA: hypothetical protein VK581_15085 [Chthoniobacterales bacterium]|nr:hypothetical protein [Chthoniobacterales bacterium]